MKKEKDNKIRKIFDDSQSEKQSKTRQDLKIKKQTEHHTKQIAKKEIYTIIIRICEKIERKNNYRKRKEKQKFVIHFRKEAW